jgi:hypothetical protein
MSLLHLTTVSFIYYLLLQGDSGGPAQIQDGCTWRVVAVTSLGRSCGAQNTPALYATVNKAFIGAQIFGQDHEQRSNGNQHHNQQTNERGNNNHHSMNSNEQNNYSRRPVAGNNDNKNMNNDRHTYNENTNDKRDNSGEDNHRRKPSGNRNRGNSNRDNIYNSNESYGLSIQRDNGQNTDTISAFSGEGSNSRGNRNKQNKPLSFDANLNRSPEIINIHNTDNGRNGNRQASNRFNQQYTANSNGNSEYNDSIDIGINNSENGYTNSKRKSNNNYRRIDRHSEESNEGSQSNNFNKASAIIDLNKRNRDDEYVIFEGFISREAE